MTRKMTTIIMKVVAAAAVMIMVMALPPGAAAQPSCVSSLVPCAPYLSMNSTPPDTCCGPLKMALTDELPCICGLLDNQQFLAQFNVTIGMIDHLATACGVTNLNLCSAPAPAPPSLTTDSPLSSPSPFAATDSPLSSPEGSMKGAASRTGWIGFSGLTSLILFWCSFLAY